MMLSPSICTAGYSDVADTIRWIEANGCDRVHIDIMDGSFVKPLMGGTDYVNMVRQTTVLPIELHFMTYDVEKMLEMYDVHKGETIYIHAETTYHPHRLLQYIKSLGAVPGLALSHYDKTEDALELLNQCDSVLLMGVEAGKPASKFYWSVIDKCLEIKTMAEKINRAIQVEVDGSVSPNNIAELVKCGVDAVVLGYPGCFDPEKGRDYTLSLMKTIINKLSSSE